MLSVVCVVSVCAGDAGSRVVLVVVLCVCGGPCVVVVVSDCDAVCAMTGRDRAITTIDPRTTTSNFFDFIRYSFFLW